MTNNLPASARLLLSLQSSIQSQGGVTAQSPLPVGHSLRQSLQQTSKNNQNGLLKPLPQKAGEPLTKLDWLMSAAMVPPGGSKNAKKAEAKMADKFSHLAKAVKGKESF